MGKEGVEGGERWTWSTFHTGGGGKGRLLPEGPWLVVLIPNPVWGLVQPPGEWWLLRTVKEERTASTTGWWLFHVVLC